ncbi:hypothetical protein DFQ27_003303 [Actinomortierella ambigua]|uniref:Uncharacterized protein n=1 Tax=Actinomortierella ambigua TaxID=1343610 RepID=A0A9P6U653_9FUNG|nr:hypothetical protein DFQ27_003303 [Actinomortierella ambigua]
MKGEQFIHSLFLLVLMAKVTAQEAHVAPLPASWPAYAKYKDKLYIYSGTAHEDQFGRNSISTGQFFALDLSKAWNSTMPEWIKLPEGPANEYLSGAISLDGKVFMTFRNQIEPDHWYSFEKNSWAPFNHSLSVNGAVQYPVTLGTDGSVLVVGGYDDDYAKKVSADENVYLIYSATTGRGVTRALPPYGINGTPVLPARGSYKAAWSDHLKSAVFYGGWNPSVDENLDQWVSLYHPETKKWKLLQTSGINSKTSEEHCVAITDDGKKLLSYGGRAQTADVGITYTSALENNRAGQQPDLQ